MCTCPQLFALGILIVHSFTNVLKPPSPPIVPMPLADLADASCRRSPSASFVQKRCYSLPG